MKDRAVLHSIEQERAVTRETDGAFLYEFQKSLLLALREAGRLDGQQYRYAEAKLRAQFRANESKGGETL